MLTKFDLAAILSIDGGRIREAFEAAMGRCRADCEDRPGLKKARVVNLKMTMEPIMDPDCGDLEQVNIQFHITDTAPKRESKKYTMVAQRGGLAFNEMAPDDARQHTIDEVTGEISPKEAVHAG